MKTNYFLLQVSDSIYDLMGGDTPSSQKMQFVDKVFTRMDMDGDGVVTKDEFISYCSNNIYVTQSMGFLP